MAPVAHSCNPSYSGGTEQQDHGSKPTNNWRDPIKKYQTQDLVKWLPNKHEARFKAQYCQISVSYMSHLKLISEPLLLVTEAGHDAHVIPAALGFWFEDSPGKS
jgi:hypothetical protein